MVMETNIREYGEELPVEIVNGKEFLDIDKGRLLIRASNECGFNSTYVDLMDVLDWVKMNKPELLDLKLDKNCAGYRG